jgi:hypothetical protein
MRLIYRVIRWWKKLTSICKSTEEILANDVPIAVEAKELQTKQGVKGIDHRCGILGEMKAS